MRGRAWGFGVRISSMVGLFVITIVEAHRPDLGLDEGLFLSRDAVLRVQVLVCPGAVPRLHRHPNVSGVGRVLSDLSQRDKEPKEPRCVVGLQTLGSIARVNVKEQKGLSAD